MEQLLTNSSDPIKFDFDYCREKLSNTAIVTFELTTDEITFINKSKKLTFNMALANLGMFYLSMISVLKGVNQG